MKPFEELYTAWIDGRLTADELAEFERALPDRSAAEADRAQVRACADLLRRHADAPSLANADFFSLQLQERIAADGPPARPAAPTPTREWFGFTLPGMAWACAFCAVGSIAAYHTGRSDNFGRIPITPPTFVSQPAVYNSSIIKTTTDDPAISATNVYSEDGMPVLWLDGLDYLPATYQLQ